jgi:flagellar basal-body rod modification protein FlgD
MAIAPTTNSPALAALQNQEAQQSAAQDSAIGLGEDFSTFLTLLTTQLQNQDPLDPTDTNEFTNQIVNFTGVEQQIRTNQNLEALADLTRVNNLASAASFLGQEALIEADTATHEGNGATFQYVLPDTATSTTLEILNSDGEVVLSQPGEVLRGANVFDWQGINNNGTIVPDGTYSLRVTAVDAEDAAIPATVLVQDTITEVETITDTPIFTVGSNIVSQSGILRIIAAQSTTTAQQNTVSLEDEVSAPQATTN